jgi:ketosteroid isomerase-like protein
MAVVRRDRVEAWVRAYEEAWRAAGTDRLAELFTADVTYRPGPWEAEIRGLADLADFWEAERDGPDEGFAMTSEVVAVDADTSVVRVEVHYDDEKAGTWRDLWVLRFTAGGRCAVFEEWPHAAAGGGAEVR